MTTQFENFTINSEYLGNKEWGFNDTSRNYNNHKITVKNRTTSKQTSFEFWASIRNPEIKKRDDLLSAFNCFVMDAISGEQNFEDFCSECGYNSDSRKAEKIHKACIKSLNKLKRIYDGDIYELESKLQDF